MLRRCVLLGASGWFLSSGFRRTCRLSPGKEPQASVLSGHGIDARVERGSQEHEGDRMADGLPWAGWLGILRVLSTAEPCLQGCPGAGIWSLW